MIIVRLMGGLGNQLFQYAIGRAVSQRSEEEFKMDILGYENQSGSMTPRKYALQIFNIQENFADKKELEKMKGKVDGRLLKILQRWGLLKKHDFFVAEPHFNFAPEILEVSGDVYLQGYWQTEKYFKDIEELLRKELTLRAEFSIQEKEITQEIKNCQAVSLHIRRGDYVSSATTGKFHGICSLEYYAQAIEKLKQQLENPTFFVFSDDIAWVKENLKIDFPTKYVSDGNLKDYEDLVLMSFCKHNIIANSSFSWWGAWLNQNPEKIVIAPKRWFADTSIDTSDIIPENWIRI